MVILYYYLTHRVTDWGFEHVKFEMFLLNLGNAQEIFEIRRLQEEQI